ncbi:uncharacterized protein TNCV_3129231 [Trichonephila clavipes]|nr:uncharacterized protein TNCV_3129231 [Trichonephila clavipes]
MKYCYLLPSKARANQLLTFLLTPGTEAETALKTMFLIQPDNTDGNYVGQGEGDIKSIVINLGTAKTFGLAFTKA